MRTGPLARQGLLQLAAAALLFTANSYSLSLPSLDDCFYARKGVEMARSGNWLTVTWNGLPTFQNPALPVWILASSFRLFGENDLAARLPSIVMALGVLVGVLAVGRRLWGESESLTAGALLLLTPFFANHARRAMFDMALALWVLLAMSILLIPDEISTRKAWLSLPLGAGILTKSVLGLLPLLVLAVAALVSHGVRRWLRNPWLWAGVILGLALGAVWPLHQWLTHGSRFLQQHFVTEIAARSMAGFNPSRVLLGYPAALLGSYQPVILLALAAIPSLVRRDSGPGGRLIVVWVVAPALLYSLSSAQSPRYLFPTLPAMALAAGYWLQRRYPGVAAWVRRSAPPVALAAAAVFWTAPTMLARSGNDSLKFGSAIRDTVPAGASLPYLGGRYWGFANPILYYQERLLEAPSPSAETAVAAARARQGVLLVDRDRLPEVEATARIAVMAASGDWVLARVL